MTRKTMMVISILLAAGCSAGPGATDVDGGEPTHADAAPRPPMPDAQMPDATRPMADGGCDPNAPDPIDADGIDSNCDGFDGVAAQEVFVAPEGNDSNPGTPGFPVATLAHAIELAAGKPIIVGVGDYHEDLNVSGVAPNLHGGYVQSAGWVRVSDRRSRILTTTAGVRLYGLSADAEIDRVDIGSADASNGPYESVFALRASGNVQLTIRDAHITAGNTQGVADMGTPGVAGPSGAAGTPGSYTGATGIGGTSPCSTAGTNGGTGGGAAGNRGWDGTDGNPGFAQLTLDAYRIFPGTDGADGSDGTSGTGGASTSGGIVTACPAGVRSISNSEASSGGGGGGGAGCHGTHGTKGYSGAGSFAIVISQVRLVVIGSSVTAGNGMPGGAGGNGGAGGIAGRGGAGGTAVCGSQCETVNNRPICTITYALAAGAGGSGGVGGRGGHGGGGAGGHSVGVAELAGATVTIGSGAIIGHGTAGAGGASRGRPGPDGIAADVHPF